VKHESTIERVLVLNIDGLRQDVFHSALQSGEAPTLAALLSQGPVLHTNPLTVAPSTTFACQASIITGLTPGEHKIVGNQFFDRFGSYSGGNPKHFAFDIGDILAYDDAVRVFVGKTGLANRHLPKGTPTLFERLQPYGMDSVVAHYMYARGARHWIRPSVLDLARFKKGGAVLGLSPAAYDQKMLRKVEKYLLAHPLPGLLYLYFMGVDYTSHYQGPDTQYAYLTRTLDPQLRSLVSLLTGHSFLGRTTVVVISDHGQTAVQSTPQHAIRMSSVFERDIAQLFDALSLTVHTFPLRESKCNAVCASNGGMAQVYLRKSGAGWDAPPYFRDQVIPLAVALDDANRLGRYCSSLEGSLSAILLRDVEAHGWSAPYLVYTKEGLFPSDAYFADHNRSQFAEAAWRLQSLSCEMSGDIILLSNQDEGYYFGGQLLGCHGGLHRDESACVMSISSPPSPIDRQPWQEHLLELLERRKLSQKRDFACISDLPDLVEGLVRSSITL
jgi:hypothetical protein